MIVFIASAGGRKPSKDLVLAINGRWNASDYWALAGFQVQEELEEAIRAQVETWGMEAQAKRLQSLPGVGPVVAPCSDCVSRGWPSFQQRSESLLRIWDGFPRWNKPGRPRLV